MISFALWNISVLSMFRIHFLPMDTQTSEKRMKNDEATSRMVSFKQIEIRFFSFYSLHLLCRIYDAQSIWYSHHSQHCDDCTVASGRLDFGIAQETTKTEKIVSILECDTWESSRSRRSTIETTKLFFKKTLGTVIGVYVHKIKYCSFSL